MDKEENLSKNYYYQLMKTIAIALLVIVLGLVAVNQTISYLYKSAFIQDPCGLCADLNEHLRPCFKAQSTTYTDLMGNPISNITKWKEENNGGFQEINFSLWNLPK